MALPLFFSPVRVGGRFYIDGGVGRISDIDVAVERGAGLVVVVNPNVPVKTTDSINIPAGHGSARSLRDKGMMWVYNQAVRAGVQSRLHDAIERAQAKHPVDILLLEPDGADTIRFLHNAASFAARREILEASYRSTRERVRRWIAARKVVAESFGWRTHSSQEGASIPAPANID
jgi:predicted acylesterase/phospholipase RssA